MAKPNITWGADRYWPWACFGALFLLALPLFPDPESDSPQYLKMAYGLIGEVPKPFSGRVLVPLAARMLARISHVDVESSFAIIAIFAYAALALTVRKLAGRLQIDGRLTALAWLLPLKRACESSSPSTSGRHLPAVLADHLPSGDFNLIALLFGLSANVVVYLIVRRRT
jgi:hypothetical protein